MICITYYSVYFPFSRITRRTLWITWAQVACTVSVLIWSHESIEYFLETSTTGWDTMQAFCSNMEHIPKSKRFRSSEEGGHISSNQKEVKFLWHHAWAFLAVWDIAPSYYCVKHFFNTKALTQGTTFPFNMLE